MKFLIFALCAIQLASAIHQGVDVSPREHRFMASIQFGLRTSFTHTCGAVILSPNWVMTSDACYQPDTILRQMIIVAGNRDLGSNPATQQIVGVDHRRVVRLQAENLALIRTNRSFVFDEDFVNAIRLPTGNLPTTGDAVFMGWGPSGVIIRRNILQRAVFPLAPRNQCDANLNVPLQPFNFCTGPFSGGRMTCERNEGGPLFRGTSKEEVLLGILVRTNTNCGPPGRPTGVYTDVFKYINWIRENTAL